VTGDEGQLVPFTPTATTDASYSVDGLSALMVKLFSAVATFRCQPEQANLQSR